MPSKHWQARLSLNYRLQGGRTLCDFSHDGPLRVLQSLYPEGEGICHNVLVHPPAGLTGGDVLSIDVQVTAGAHGLITTPGATRFYRSSGEPCAQRAVVHVAAGARLEWLPLENIAYSGCLAENALSIRLEPGAQMLGWDASVLGLPASGLGFEQGYFLQSLHMPGVWQERGRVDASDQRLLNSPLGLNGKTCWGTVYLLRGEAWPYAERDALLDAARDAIQSLPQGEGQGLTAGATSPHAQVMVVRVLADSSEGAMNLCRGVWAAWRAQAWGLSGSAPRIWST
ncbi:MAG: hypothetical protein RLZZ126_1569 [Pseudomonadota bacterium]|jgi:urease accessory protein